MLDPELIADDLSNRLGLQFEGTLISQTPETCSITLRPVDLPSPEGFSTNFSLGWRSLQCTFVFDNFASRLLHSMSVATAERRSLFSSMMELCRTRGMDVTVKINGMELPPSKSPPPEPWQAFELSAVRLGVDSNMARPELHAVFFETTHLFLSLIMTLLPTREIQNDAHSLFEPGLPEGAKIRVEMNRYERSAFNRSVCLAAHGPICKACGFVFADFYGPLGSGFIEIHHLVMVSRMGENYVVDPVRDLIPLCSNCHAMIHRQDPPLTLQELRNLISLQRGGNV